MFSFNVHLHFYFISYSILPLNKEDAFDLLFGPRSFFNIYN